MAFPLPPWLDVKPRDFADAAATGASLGIKQGEAVDAASATRGKLALDAQRIAQESMADQARIAMAGQQLASAERRHALEAKINDEQTQKKFLYDQQRNSVADAYRMATLGLAKTKLEDVAKQSAMVMAHKQGFAQSIASGMSPAEAAAKYPLAMTTGIATQIAKPPTNSTNTETVTERYPEVESVEASKGFLGFGAREAVLGQPARTISYKRPREGAFPIPDSLRNTNSAALKFIRDAEGNLVLSK